MRLCPKSRNPMNGMVEKVALTKIGDDHAVEAVLARIADGHFRAIFLVINSVRDWAGDIPDLLETARHQAGGEQLIGLVLRDPFQMDHAHRVPCRNRAIAKNVRAYRLKHVRTREPHD